MVNKAFDAGVVLKIELTIFFYRFPVPAKKLEIKVYQLGKKVVIDDTFNLDYYERVVQVILTNCDE